MMTIAQAKQLYFSVVTEAREDDFHKSEWREIRDELLAVVSAKTLDDAILFLKQKEYGEPEECAKGFREEWARMSGNNYVVLSWLVDFIRESNRIEGIKREPTGEEIAEMRRFLGLPQITVPDLVHFVSIYQPDAMLREHEGMNVIVGNHMPPKGGPNIRIELQALLQREDLSPFERHVAFETLHPFTDGNGRVGRAIWLRDMNGTALLGFLHAWYYQSLDASRK